jgi:hypothetical protein
VGIGECYGKNKKAKTDRAGVCEKSKRIYPNP